jgi:RNA polymerase sigma-70 factor, ECF subfamily
LSDAELLALVNKADASGGKAFTEIYARYSHPVYLYCRRLSNHQDEANDVFQETFIRFHKQIKSSSNILNIQPYLIRIARNVFLNLKRDEPPWSMDSEEVSSSYTPHYEREELFNLISTALELLEFSYKEAFVLRFYQGHSYKEMAGITGDSVSALKVRVMRAKDQIREIVAPYIEDLNIE